jgi:hypothetical protein
MSDKKVPPQKQAPSPKPARHQDFNDRAQRSGGGYNPPDQTDRMIPTTPPPPKPKK